jgi:uncharacterized protein (TIGR02996 family)
MIDANEGAFLRSIAEEGNDNTGRLAFADWLEELGDAPARTSSAFSAS